MSLGSIVLLGVGEMSFRALAWCVTGGGAGLRDVVDVMQKIKGIGNVRITVFLTRWGFEVARIFGVLPRIRSIASGGYYEEFLVGDEGMYYIGRLNRRSYKLLVVAPATSNSVAKFVRGIADSVASALFSQAIKSGVPVVVLPTDIPNEMGVIVSESPCYVDRAVCAAVGCRECSVVGVCPVNAIKIVEGAPRIDIRYCIGCEKCVSACPHGAVRCWDKVYLSPNPVDVENIERLKKMKNVYVVSNASQLLDTILSILNG